MVKYVSQETERGCGQACVAMLASLSFERGVEMVGKKGLTRTKDIKNALEKIGIKTAKKLKVVTLETPLPPLCIVKIKWKDTTKSHWSIYDNGDFLDPYFGRIRGGYEKLDGKITSFLEIFNYRIAT